jgi:hypothetical protein
MEREIKVGSISWIHKNPNPVWLAAGSFYYEPDWIPKTYIGLAGTCNPAPGAAVADFLKYQKDRKFRALTYCRFKVTIDDATDRVTGFQVLDAVHDPGWTPDFSMTTFPSTLLSFDTSIYSFKWYQGEASGVSLVNTQARHKNTTLPATPDGETVLVNSLIKFRAGKHTDDVGINNVGAPYHVPWVWCETLLTYVGFGVFSLTGRGSVFPSHAWYFNDQQVRTVAQTGDTSFPTAWRAVCAPVPGYGSIGGYTPTMCFPASLGPSQIVTSSLKIYPVLSAGAPAGGPQTKLADEVGLTGAVDTHNNTATGNKEWTTSVKG